MKDRLSIHLDNGQSEIFEAVTVLRNGGSPAQSGLVGITNKKLADASSDPYLPETIFNVHATGDSNIRFSSGPNRFYRSSIELIGAGNTRASGLHISYDPGDDNAFITTPGVDGYTDLCVTSETDLVVADFSLIRSSGCCGMEFSHISMSERGYVGIGVTRRHNERLWSPNAPLTVAYWCDDMCDSGTISMHEQSCKPTINSDYGKIYVKPWTEISPHTQALFFVDDNGTETNLIKKQDISPLVPDDGLIFGHNCNTYGGWYTPQTRAYDSTKNANTYYGWGAGFNLSEDGDVDLNTLIGCNAGSGLTPSNSNSNTVVGSKSLTGWTSAERNTIIGSEIATGGEGEFGGMEDCILIGRYLFNTQLPPHDTLAIGIGDTPLISGSLTTNRQVSVNKATFCLEGDDINLTIRNVGSDKSVINVTDANRAGDFQGESPLSFDFSNSENFTSTLFTLDPNGCVLTNTPTYATPIDCAPFAQLDGDFKLRGAIRFQDGTSLSGLNEFGLVPSFGTSGVSKNFITELNKDAYVLDYSELQLAGNVSSNIKTDNTFIAVQLDGTTSSNVGKMSLQGLADYVSSGTSSIAENCNVLIANPEAELNVNVAGISRSVMIGCDVAQHAAGWKNAVIIGADAGTNATTSNSLLDKDKPVIFIGHGAGYNADDISHAVYIGEDAGKNSNANESVFIGLNAGEASNSKESIGIGKFALAGMTGTQSIGNIEITANLSISDRLFHAADADHPGFRNKIAIQKVLAGDLIDRKLSIGDAILDPDAPLSVRRSAGIHGTGGGDYIQTWYCDGNLMASLDCDGNFDTAGTSNIVEGKLHTALIEATSITEPSTAELTPLVDNAYLGHQITITNRDKDLYGVVGAYVIVQKIGSEYRPIWVGCSQL